jgi:hypothetical protein
MAAAGFSYAPPPFFSGYDGWPTGRDLADDPVLAPVDAATIQRDGFFQQIDTLAGHREVEVRSEATNPGYTSLAKADQQRYNSQAKKCLPTESTYSDMLERPSASELKAQLDKVVADAEQSSQVTDAMAEYPACMAARDLDVKSREELVERVQQAFLNKDPADFHPGTDSWAAAAQFEDQAATADADCRRQAHDAALTALASPLEAFEAANTKGLALVDADWSALVAEALAARDQLKR